MCFGNSGAKAAQREAERARQQEDARQAEIRRGRTAINNIFDGGVYDPVERGYTPQQGGTYYRADGSVYTPPAQSAAPDSGSRGLFGGRFGPLGGGARAINGLLSGLGGNSGEQLFKGKRDGIATDEFFAKNRQAFMDYATPQLDEQFGDATKELTFDLARSGLRNSSVRGEQAGRLQGLYDKNMQQVTNEALSREQQQRNSVEGARSDLISMLQTTGDAQGATNQALSRASMLSQPQPFSPMGQLFTDFTAGLGTQAAMERAGSMSNGRFSPRYDTGLFGTPSGAVRNTR